jgi:putative transposase
MSLRNRKLLQGHEILSFVTTTVMKFEKIFSINNSYPDILIDSLKYVLNKYKADLVAYVIMPNHIHLIIFIDSVQNLSSLMRDFKKFTSTKVRQKLEKDNKFDIISRLKQNANRKKNQVFKLWMDRFDDVMLYTEDVLITKLNYIHNNPVKKGFVDEPGEWRYSSYNNYMNEDNSIIKIRRYSE